MIDSDEHVESDPGSFPVPQKLAAVADESWCAECSRALALAPSPQAASAALERLAEAGGIDSLLAWPLADLADLAVVVGGSTALVRYLVAAGPSWPELAAAYRRGNPSEAEMAEQAGLGEPGTSDPDTVGRALRVLAAHETYRIGARDLTGLAELPETLQALTRLADLTASMAVEHLRAWQVRDAGDCVDAEGRPVEFVVMGLGKLGGGELNFSSDIDLTYMYGTDAVGEGSPVAGPFFTRLAGAVTRALGDQTSDGHVFRVDLRLRPEGDNGPMVNSVDNVLGYYEGWGDTWERGAQAKARPIAGDAALGERYMEELSPFIYRRHLDFQTVEDLRTMKERIDAERSIRKPGKRNVKLGRGGIRELEFVVQALQLVHGGHHATLRVLGSMAALDALEAEGFVGAEDAAMLRSAYRFLRDVEHGVQIEEKRQTQTLPTTEHGLRRLARCLGYGCGRRGRPLGGDELEAFEADWAAHTGQVHEAFVRYLELRVGDEERGPARDPMTVALLGRLVEGELEPAAELLEQLGFPDPPRGVASLDRIYRGAFRGPASPQRRRAVDALAPALLEAVLSSSDPLRALDGMVEFLIRTGAHTSYLVLLGGSPKTMEILIRLFASSPYLAAHLVGHPELLDSLVRSDDPGVAADLERLHGAFHSAVDIDPGDEEAMLAGLRRFRTAELVRIGLHDLSEAIDAADVHLHLTNLADVCLGEAIEFARALSEARYEGPWDRLRLVAIAMGKMGAREMSYGSDLDLIFVYDTDLEGYDAEAHYLATRWIQKVITTLTTRTSEGTVYEVDARLRPSGRSGPLVVSFDRFVQYHATEGELWERQALIRARVAFGDAELAARVEGEVAGMVYGSGLDDAGVAEIAHLRGRIERELADERRDRLNIKTGVGGIVDVEFLVQMLQLRHGHDHPEVRSASTVGAIDGLAAARVLGSTEAAELSRNYRFLRRLEGRMRLEWERPVESIDTDGEGLGPLAHRLGYAGSDAGDRLLAECRRTRAEIRAAYDRVFDVGSD